MMFGIVVEVRIERHDEAGEMLESVVVPLTKASPGFVTAYWLDGTPAGCTAVEDGDECPGLELRHESDPMTCVAEWGRGDDYCGVHIE
jgi:hypothetical protein